MLIHGKTASKHKHRIQTVLSWVLNLVFLCTWRVWFYVCVCVCVLKPSSQHWPHDEAQHHYPSSIFKGEWGGGGGSWGRGAHILWMVKVTRRNPAAEMSLSWSDCMFRILYLKLQAGCIAWLWARELKQTIFPLCCIFNKAKHAGNYFPFNSPHFLSEWPSLLEQRQTFSFRTFLFTHYRKHTHSNAGHKPDSAAAVPVPLSVMWFS